MSINVLLHRLNPENDLEGMDKLSEIRDLNVFIPYYIHEVVSMTFGNIFRGAATGFVAAVAASYILEIPVENFSLGIGILAVADFYQFEYRASNDYHSERFAWAREQLVTFLSKGF